MSKATLYGKTLFARFNVIWMKKFTDFFVSDDLSNAWIEEWGESIQRYNSETVKKAINHCKLNMKWPPSLAEFIEVCDSFNGIPSFESAYRACVNRDFDCHLVEKAFNKLDTWEFRRATCEKSEKMFKKAWEAVLKENRNLPGLENKDGANGLDMEQRDRGQATSLNGIMQTLKGSNLLQ